MPPTPRPQGTKKAQVKIPSSADGSAGSNRRLLIAMGVAGLVVVASAAGYALLSGGGTSSADVTAQLEAAGCTVETADALTSSDHSITTPEGTSDTWNTSPPTSGPHYQVQAVWGSYSEPLLPAQVIHNLEHGGIFIQYGKDVPQATIDELRRFYDDHQNGTLLAPLPRLGSKIAMGVWTTRSPAAAEDGTVHVATCGSFDEDAYAAFFATYQFKGPERFPMDSLLPGS